MPSNSVHMSELVAPDFVEAYWDIIDGKHTYYDLYGGRGSGKSTFISQMILRGIMADGDANAVALRKVENTLRSSVYNQIIRAMDTMGVSHLWKCTLAPLQCTYLPTGQVIMFRGLDEAGKLKSITVPHGYIK